VKPQQKPIRDKPCWTEDIDREPICRVHNAYWSKRQSYCEVMLTKHPELVK